MKSSVSKSVVIWIAIGLIIGFSLNFLIKKTYRDRTQAGQSSLEQLLATKKILSFATDSSVDCLGERRADYYFSEDQLPKEKNINRIDLPAKVELQAMIGWRCDESLRLIRAGDRFLELSELEFENKLSDANKKCDYCLLMLRPGLYQNNPLFDLASGELYDYAGPSDQPPTGIPYD
jgi:hypothetical protein